MQTAIIINGNLLPHPMKQSSKKLFRIRYTSRTAEIFDREALSRLKSSEVIIRNDVNIYEPGGMRHSHI